MVPLVKTKMAFVGGIAIVMAAISDTVLRTMPNASKEEVSFIIAGLTFLGGLIVTLFMLGRRYQAFADSNNALTSQFATLHEKMAKIEGKVDKIDEHQSEMHMSLVEAGILSADGKSRVDPDTRFNR